MSDPWPTMIEVMTDHARKTLAHVDGNRTHAARLLGVHRRTLQRWLKGKRQKNRTIPILPSCKVRPVGETEPSVEAFPDESRAEQPAPAMSPPSVGA